MDEPRVVRRHPVDELLELQRRIPYRDQPVRVWAAWFERQAALWDVVVLVDSSQTDTAAFVGEYLRRTAKEMLEQYRPDERWPGAASWWPGVASW